MNDELKELAIAAGAPEEMLDTLWFNVFCQEFAYQLFNAMEQELVSYE